MADKVDKPKKKAKPKKDEKGVLAALPTTRLERIGGRRAAAASAPAPKTTAATSASKAAATPKRSPAAAKPSKAATSAKKSSATAKTSSTRATATRRKAAAPRTFEPTQAAESAAGAADERSAGAVPLSETPREARTHPRPRPVSEGAPGIGTAGDRDQPSPESGRPSGAELAGAAVRAAGEVAQLGLTIGGHVLKRVVDRLKP